MSRTRHVLILVALLGVAIALRLWRIDHIPPGFYFDESFEGLEAWRILTNPTYRPIFLPGNAGVDPLNSYANAGMFAVFHFFGGTAGPTAMRVTAACFGVLTVLALYGLAKELQRLDHGRHKLSGAFPLFAVASLAVMRWHIHFSRIGIEPILTPLVWVMATWLFLRGWRTGSWFAFAGSGLLLATAMYAYQAAWLIPLLMIPVTCLLLWRQTQMSEWATHGQKFGALFQVLRSRQGAGLVLTVLVACLCFAPLAWYFWQHVDQLLLRPSQLVITSTPDAETKESLGQTIWATVNMYNIWGMTGDESVRRNLPGEPVLNLWQALPFYLGLSLALWRSRRPPYAISLIGLVGLLLPGALSAEAPHFHRLLGAAAPTALLCAVGLDALWQWRPLSGAPQTMAKDHAAGPIDWWVATGNHFIAWSSILLILCGGTVSAYDYFARWANHPGLFDVFRAGLWQIGQDITMLPPEQPVYITLRDYQYPTIEFARAIKQYPAEPTTFDGRYILPVARQGESRPALYIVTADQGRYAQELLPKLFPNLQIQKELHDNQGQWYATYYLIPPHTPPTISPRFPVTATIGDGIDVLGYDLHPTELYPGRTFRVRMHWQVTATPRTDWSVAFYLQGKDGAQAGKEAAQYLNRPGRDSLPTSRWQQGWLILDEYKMKLPKDLPVSEYNLQVALIGSSSVHLPLDGQSVSLGTIRVTPAP